MRHFTLITFIALSLFIQVRAQSTSPGGTEVVVPWATSFYAGPGNSNANFCDSLNGVAYTRNSPDYSITSDGGSTWRTGKRTTQLDRIMLMYSVGRDSLVAIRDSQYIFHSFNGGESWSLANTLWSGEKFGYGIFYNHKFGIIFPPEGGFLTSTDLGVNWYTREWNYGAIKSAPRYERGYIFVREQSTSTPGIVYSSNNGISWEKLPVPASLAGFSYAGKSENGFYVVAANNTFYLLSQTGEIVKSFLPGGTENYYVGHAYVNDNEIWILNHRGQGNRELRRYSSADTSVTLIWLGFHSIYTNSIIPTTWDKLVIFNTGTLRTTPIMTFHKKGLQNLRVEQLFLPGNADASTLFFANGSQGFAGLPNGKIIITNDGGYTWSESAMPTTIGIVQKFIQRSESEFVAICGAGLILESSDGGNSWNSIISPMQKWIKSAAFKGRDTVYFCTSDSIFRTTSSWQQITPVQTGLSGGYFTNLDFYDGLNGSATYRYGYFQSKAIYTTNGGGTWLTRDFSNMIQSLDPSAVGVYYNLSNGFTTWYNDTSGGFVYQDGELDKVHHKAGGFIALSYTKGNFFYNFGNLANFYRITLGQTFSKAEPVAADANTAYLLTGGGRFFKFYKISDSPPPSTVLKISPYNESPFEFHDLSFKWEEPWSVAPILEYNLQLALGNPSNIIEDVNGITATTHNLNLTADSTIYFWRVRARNMYGWGDFNNWYTFRSSVVANEPVYWQSPLTPELSSGIMLPNGRLIVGTATGKVAISDGAQINWTIVNSGTTYPFNRLLHDPNNNFVYALTTGNLFFHSSNGGVTWLRKESPFGSTLPNSFAFAPPNLMYGAGDYGSIYKATATPTSWTNIWFSPNTGRNLEIATLDSTKIVSVGEFGSVTISTNGGQSFRFTGLIQSETFKRVSFAPDGTIVILNQNGERRVSTDLGETWSYELFETKAPIRDMISRNGVSVLIDTLGGIYTALTPTARWIYSRMPGNFKPVSVEISNNKILLPSQGGKLFYVPVYAGNPVGVEEETVVTDYNLAQNYPNPFNPSTVIEFSVKIAGTYTLEVFNALGERVTILHDGWLEPGQHRIQFNANDLANGIYLYRLRGSEVNLTKKMILLK
ncbi:hypothetical protein MASR1M107_01540 [Ignavibacteriales bacterium]